MGMQSLSLLSLTSSQVLGMSRSSHLHGCSCSSSLGPYIPVTGYILSLRAICQDGRDPQMVRGFRPILAPSRLYNRMF